MKKTYFFVWAGLILSFFTIKGNGQGTHAVWNDLLATYVNQEGMVDYEGFHKDKLKLDEYLDHLSSNAPKEAWTENEKLAYWINAYNAFTISLILQHYPVKSIMDIEKAWDIKFIDMGDKTYSLNDIEHEIIRKEFDEPRIHFVLVCAAMSCPVLLNEAYLAETLVAQLQKQGEVFINDPFRNKVSEKKVQLSQLFNWYKDDFTKQGSLVDFLNGFTSTTIDKKASVGFLAYDWGLNKQ